MSKEVRSGNDLITAVTNYTYWFMAANLYFSICNLPFILVWSASYLHGNRLQNEINPLLILSIIPAGPAITAMFSIMGKLVRNRDISVTKDFFTAYKKNFGESLFYGAVITAILSIIYLDILYFKTKAVFSFMQILLLIIGFIVLSLVSYIFPIISRFYFKPFDVIKLSIIYSIKKIHVTFFNWTCLLAIIILSSKVSIIAMLFLWSILCYAIMFNEKNLLVEIEDKYCKKPVTPENE